MYIINSSAIKRASAGFKFRKMKIHAAIGLIACLIFAYLICMFIVPFIQSQGSWGYVHQVWYDWQSFNVGMLAFIASCLAIYSTQISESQKNQRNFLAAKALLALELSKFSEGYLRDSADILNKAWDKAHPIHWNDGRPVLPKRPSLEDTFKAAFSDLVKTAPPEVGIYLANFLRRLQIFNSRIVLFTSDEIDKDLQFSERNLITSCCDFGWLAVQVEELFLYSRSQGNFAPRGPTWDIFSNCFRVFNLLEIEGKKFSSEQHNLKEEVERRIKDGFDNI